MDTWALLDHTLAHEFTHTWKGGETNIFDEDRGRKEQYGLSKPVQNLKFKTPVTDMPHPEWNSITKDDVKAWGHENADSFAYYGLGRWFLPFLNFFAPIGDLMSRADLTRVPQASA